MLPPNAPGAGFTRRVLIVLGLTTLFVFVSLVLCFGKTAFFLIFAGTLFASFLRALTDFTRRWTRLPDGWALTVVVAALLGLFGLACWFLSARVGSQIDVLIANLRSGLAKLRDQLQHYQWGRELLGSSVTGGLLSDHSMVLRSVNSAVGLVAEVFGDALVIMVVGIYVAINPGLYRRGILHLVPLASRDRANAVLLAMGVALRGWLVGRFVNMIIIGVLTTLGLWLLGVPLALVLGLIAFALDFIPYFGPLFAAFPAVLVGLAAPQGPMMGLWVAALYFGIQLLESHVTLPLIQRKAIDMPPALLIASEALLGFLAGPLGMIFAVPLAAVGLVFVRMTYVESTLGDFGAMPVAERRAVGGDGHATPVGQGSDSRLP